MHLLAPGGAILGAREIFNVNVKNGACLSDLHMSPDGMTRKLHLVCTALPPAC